MKNAIIMAAGKGTRMKSDLPKVLHEVCGQTMVERIVDTLNEAGCERIITVVGYRHALVEEILEDKCEFAIQEPQLGTGHAIMQVHQLEDEDGITIVTSGDVPCVRKETFQKLYDACLEGDMVVLTAIVDDPRAYGRIVRDENGEISRIVEFKDCNEEEKEIKEINTGIYAFNNPKLFSSLQYLNNDNAQGEYYITDLVEIFKNQGYKVIPCSIEDIHEVQGVNTDEELEEIEAYLKERNA